MGLLKFFPWTPENSLRANIRIVKENYIRTEINIPLEADFPSCRVPQSEGSLYIGFELVLFIEISHRQKKSLPVG